MKSGDDRSSGVWCYVAKCTTCDFGCTDDPQDDVGRRWSQVVMWPSGQGLHAYALYWAVGLSSKGFYLLLQWTYVLNSMSDLVYFRTRVKLVSTLSACLFGWWIWGRKTGGRNNTKRIFLSPSPTVLTLLRCQSQKSFGINLHLVNLLV